jgi:hypothetical protein
MEILLEILFGLAGGLTARWLLPRIFGGRIQVLPTPLPRSWWSLRIHTRLPNGQIGIDPEAATFFGAIFWMMLAIAGIYLFYLFRRHAAH